MEDTSKRGMAIKTKTTMTTKVSAKKICFLKVQFFYCDFSLQTMDTKNNLTEDTRKRIMDMSKKSMVTTIKVK